MRMGGRREPGENGEKKLRGEWGEEIKGRMGSRVRGEEGEGSTPCGTVRPVSDPKICLIKKEGEEIIILFLNLNIFYY